ncbi:heterokaryon incompatibility protein-domain-containing protein [Cercophora newfieldiana]|uniref:Heterokaryon incompatibility protein-domain-containing protein n=1 Tax=Cercophora newfieldiana TaxID=92897 RepID=A0AA39YSB2_9PEZI|nr:heterokaryon incompatibility protein-domain-containing protein [Cercophora newfieldiana]
MSEARPRRPWYEHDGDGNYDFYLEDELYDSDDLRDLRELRGIALARKANNQANAPRLRTASERAIDVLGALDGSSASSQIRLLAVLPSDQYRGRIECSIERVDLGSPSAGEYMALSYMWSDMSAAKESILLNGTTWAVSQNVADCLRRIRHKTDSRRIWIDAICINQVDPAERGHQVGLMRRIYECSTECTVWLGEFDRVQGLDVSNHAMRWDGDIRDERHVDSYVGPDLERRAVEELVEAPDGGNKNTWETTKEKNLAGAFCLLAWASQNLHLPDIPLFQDAACLASSTPECLQAMSWILSRPYWTRAWIVQEVAVARHVVVQAGRLIAPFSLITKAVANLGRHLNGCCQRWMMLLPESFVDTIPTLELAAFYILPLGQIRHKWHEKSDISGSSPLTLTRLVASTYSRGATDPRDKIYSLLGLVQSWEGQNPLEADYLASPYDVAIRFVVNGTHLVLKGYRLGQLQVVTRPFELFPFPDIAPLAVLGWDTYPPSDETWELAYWRTMYLDVVTDGQTNRLRRFSNEDTARIVADCTKLRSGTSSSHEEVSSEDGEHAHLPRWCFDGDVVSELEHKTIFRTSRGYLGLALSDVAPTDEVFLPIGSPMPLVVRPGPRGGQEVDGFGTVKCHTLVGWCYVHGVMDGELIKAYGEMGHETGPLFLK